MNRKDLQHLAAIRLKEAKVLYGGNCWEGAYYLAGYAVELALKACIAKQTVRHEFPDKRRVNESHTHNLEELLRLAGLRDVLIAGARNSPQLNVHWAIVRDWWAESRYLRPSQADAANLLGAIEDKRFGIFRWLKQFW